MKNFEKLSLILKHVPDTGLVSVSFYPFQCVIHSKASAALSKLEAFLAKKLNLKYISTHTNFSNKDNKVTVFLYLLYYDKDGYIFQFTYSF
jgi:hypothetical protein